MDKRTVFKIYILFFVLIGVISTVSPAAFAQAVLNTGRATVYKVTMSQFEIDNGDGTTPITAFSGTSATLDIASALDTNTSVGSFLSGLSVSDGSYSRVKPTPSGAFTIAGSVSFGGSTYYTTGSARTGGGCLTNTTGPAQECNMTIDVGAQDWQSLGGTITVKNGTPNYRVRVRFNTANALGLYNGPGGTFEIYPQQPSTSVTLIPQ